MNLFRPICLALLLVPLLAACATSDGMPSSTSDHSQGESNRLTQHGY